MKLQDCQCYVVANQPPYAGGKYFILVKLETQCGNTGLGEVYSATFGPEVIKAMVLDTFARFFEGEDPFRLETLWRRVYGAGYNLRPDPSLLGVLSGLEIACWDIIGKSTGQPIYALLGGKVHERLRTYSYVYPDPDKGDYYSAGDGIKDYCRIYNDISSAAERTQVYLDMGMTAVKFDPVGGYSVFDPRQPTLEVLENCRKFIGAIREVAGTKADILFGTHGQFTVSGAIRIGKAIEEACPLWFEEPTPPEMPEEMALVARAVNIPIATGERLCSKYEFQRVLQTKAASILQPDLGRVGGLMEAKKIAAMAESCYVQLAPHLYCGPAVFFANAHLSTASPNFLILETIENFSGFYANLLKSKHQWQDGYLYLSDEPGLGVELDEELALAHIYQGDQLHLEMVNDPIY